MEALFHFHDLLVGHIERHGRGVNIILPIAQPADGIPSLPQLEKQLALRLGGAYLEKAPGETI